MDTELLHRILDAARTAATGSAAMAIEDLQREFSMLPDDVADTVVKADAFDKLKAHIAVQPFDTSEEDDDDGTVTITPLRSGAYHDWLNELENLAQ